MGELCDLESGPRMVAVTGKGGVGKTTCSAATAVHLAETGQRTLLLSTDRSPSLSDILETDVFGEITSVDGVDGLDAVEMDYDAIREKWKETYGEDIYRVFSSFVSVGEEVIDYVAEAPGIADEFMLGYILEYFEGDVYDRIVWDTAPAGGTIALLEAQERFYDHLGQAPKIYADLRSLASGDLKKRPATLFEEWRELSADCLSMVQGPDTTFVVVTIAEGLGVNETDRIIDDLERHDLGVQRVVANKVLEDVGADDCKHHRERAAMHAEYLEVLEDRYASEYGVATIPQLPREVKGLEAIETVSDHLFESAD
ncbi:ArsA family ATPase [Natronobacterium gregoryi]|uniref:ATPase n=2 Tax=Natronobacterium gregoryi TaxID=44930 RepID=L0AG66_NATGS|nr:ArsA family ATPase [Natronobacterium gregoryi]AFZ72060.1 arsenite-activated ATPase ArsA [Natronobacterium gregoryi SP2]ELY62767.1 oxyanion-translocating atpase, arsa [Natronobacterium gregoryi SP2]PLK20034.1 ATPase [Natronobacterium gregoryi SP2]SFJ44796.1 arsenite efflux ATP-binding protein ArsA [Natronobacterium gregoryi]